MGILAIQKGGTGHVLFYTLGYGLATVGAFGVVTLVRGRDADGNVLGEATSCASGLVSAAPTRGSRARC